MASAEVTMIPQTYVTLTDEADITNIGRILDFLDDDDDVQEVYQLGRVKLHTVKMRHTQNRVLN